MEKRIIYSVVGLMLLIAFVANVSAITGRLGNSRMILNADVGESVRRYLFIENPNDVPITIVITPSGDLINNLNLEENDFVLQPNENKNVYFTIKADEAGSTETKLNVMFKPPQGNGVGLSATVILNAGGSAADNSDEDNGGFLGGLLGGNEDNGETVEENGDVSGMPWSPFTVLISISVALIVIFLILLVYLNKVKKKRSGRPRA